MNAELYQQLAAGRSDYLKDHKRFASDIVDAVTQLEALQAAHQTSPHAVLSQLTSELADPVSLHQLDGGQPSYTTLPSLTALDEIIDLCRSVLFPGYYGKSGVTDDNRLFHIGVALERLYDLLSQQIGTDVTMAFLRQLPDIRRTLATDVKATYLGDPAAQTYSEVIACYPVIKAITNYRIAHALLGLGVELIPRIITEMAHSETGIDIHPAATIGDYFTIDHGTGVVIGATCIIGCHVKLYQGVTLGAKSFPLDSDGHPIKNIPRHPILEDNVIVYANSTILGRITIGHDAVIGGNIWVTESVEPGTKILQNKFCR
ncbi:MAG: serine acetyltransferase [Bacteroidales bacterium]|nr:serine acetyltransferase [Bacteroidales bacterium]